MEHYVTLFDSAFLPQGMALHRSMERWAGPYTLWVLCLDEATHRALNDLHLANVRLIRLADVETPALRDVKAGRTRAEYCWTLTPFTPRFVFEAEPGAARVTYVDADMWMRKSPAPIFAELEAAGGQVLITEHAYAPEYDQSATSGTYCVQFQTFTREGGEPVRQWWADRCIEWCFARFEDGKFGDQKYLDDWPDRFPDRVHVLERREWMLAPWNATRFPHGEAILYHFHGLRLQDGGFISAGADHALPPVVRANLYEPYVADLRAALAALKAVGFDAPVQQRRPGLLEGLRLRIEALFQDRWRLRINRPWKI